MRSGAQSSKAVLWPQLIARSRSATRAATITVSALVTMLLAACAGQPADHAATSASTANRSAAQDAATRVPVPRFKPARGEAVEAAAAAEAERMRLISPAPRVIREALRVRLDAVDVAEHEIAAAWPAPAAGPSDVAPILVWPSPARPSVAGGGTLPEEPAAPDGVAGSDASVLADMPAMIWPSPARPDVATGEGSPSNAVAAPRVEHEGGPQAPVAEVADGAGIGVSRGMETEGEALTQVVWVTDRTEDLRAASRAASEALRGGQPARALAIYQEILTLLPGERSTLLGAAAALRQLGRAAEAERIYRLLLRKNPHDRFVETALWGLLGEREPQAALAQLRRLVWQDPDDGRVRAQIGLILARQGQLDRAIAELQVALRLDPANARYRADLLALREARAGRASEPIRALAPTQE